MERPQQTLQKEKTAVSGEKIRETLLQLKTNVSLFYEFLPTLVEHFTEMCQSFQAGQIGTCLSAWNEISNDRMLLSHVIGTQIDLFEKLQQHTLPCMLVTDAEHEIIEREISKLLQKGFIVTVSHKKGQILSSIFLRPKKDGTHRLILNLKRFNESLTYHNFEMDSFFTITKLITRHCYMASLDLTDG